MKAVYKIGDNNLTINGKPIIKHNKTFITEWELTDTTFSFPGGVDNITYNWDYYIDWGDGSELTNVQHSSGATHNYSSTGTYQIKVTGSLPNINSYDYSTYRTKLTKVIAWGEVNFKSIFRMFYGCENLSYIPDEPIPGESIVVSDTSTCFYKCKFKIPEKLFIKCQNITSFNGTFYGFDFTQDNFTIPSNIFKYNTNILTLGDTFRLSNIKTIPEGIFDYNTNIINFGRCFYLCDLLEDIPETLFRKNTNVISYSNCFYGCNKLDMNEYIFCAPGEESTIFLNKSIDFTNFFYLTDTFDGLIGVAPELWNYNYGTGTPTKTDAFQGHSISSLTNYSDIPEDWK